MWNDRFPHPAAPIIFSILAFSLLTCTPPPKTQKTAGRPRTSARTRPRKTRKPRKEDPLKRAHRLMAQWIAELKAAKTEKPIDLAQLLTVSVPSTTSANEKILPITNTCTAKSKNFNVITEKTFSISNLAASKANEKKAKKRKPLPVFFVYPMPSPASFSTEKSSRPKNPPSTCLVRVVMKEDIPQIVAAPLVLTEDDQMIDEVTIQRRNACRLLEIKTSFSTTTGPSGEEESSRGETIKIWDIDEIQIDMLGEYQIMRNEEGLNGYSSSFLGFLTWTQLGKDLSNHFLVYRATLMESGHLTKWKPKKREVVQVEKLRKKCQLETIAPHELDKLRKLPGGQLLPKKLHPLENLESD
jgi:hypothetical protein